MSAQRVGLEHDSAPPTGGVSTTTQPEPVKRRVTPSELDGQAQSLADARQPRGRDVLLRDPGGAGEAEHLALIQRGGEAEPRGGAAQATEVDDGVVDLPARPVPASPAVRQVVPVAPRSSSGTCRRPRWAPQPPGIVWVDRRFPFQNTTEPVGIATSLLVDLHRRTEPARGAGQRGHPVASRRSRPSGTRTDRSATRYDRSSGGRSRPRPPPGTRSRTRRRERRSRPGRRC